MATRHKAERLAYPSWRYHDTEPARIVQTAEEDAALPPGWRKTVQAVVGAPAPAPVAEEIPIAPDPKVAASPKRPVRKR